MAEQIPIHDKPKLEDLFGSYDVTDRHSDTHAKLKTPFYLRRGLIS